MGQTKEDWTLCCKISTCWPHCKDRQVTFHLFPLSEECFWCCGMAWAWEEDRWLCIARSLICMFLCTIVHAEHMGTWLSTYEMCGISRLGNCDVLNGSDDSTELGDRRGYAKQGKIYGDRHFCWESRQESRNFCKLVLALRWYARETNCCLEVKAGLTRLQWGETGWGGWCSPVLEYGLLGLDRSTCIAHVREGGKGGKMHETWL